MLHDADLAIRDPTLERAQQTLTGWSMQFTVIRDSGPRALQLVLHTHLERTWAYEIVCFPASQYRLLS